MSRPPGAIPPPHPAGGVASGVGPNQGSGPPPGYVGNQQQAAMMKQMMAMEQEKRVQMHMMEQQKQQLFREQRQQQQQQLLAEQVSFPEVSELLAEGCYDTSRWACVGLMSLLSLNHTHLFFLFFFMLLCFGPFVCSSNKSSLSSPLHSCCLVACIITLNQPPSSLLLFISGMRLCVCVCVILPHAACCDNVMFSFYFSLCEGIKW